MKGWNVKGEIFKGEDDLWYCHIRARNGRIVLYGEGYERRRDAYNALDLARVGAAKMKMPPRTVKARP